MTMFADHPSQQPTKLNPSTTVRRLVVEVIEARDLLPKEGQGSCSPYVIIDFDGQKKRTSTVKRNLNPVWNEAVEFFVLDPKTMEFEELNVEVYNDKKLSNGNARKSHFLGRVKLYGMQFAKRGDEGLAYFTLEKKSVFSWIRGELGLKIYYYDEILVEEAPPQEQRHPQVAEQVTKKPVVMVYEEPQMAMPTHIATETRVPSPPVHRHEPSGETVIGPSVERIQALEFCPEVRKMQVAGGRAKILRRPANGDYSPRIISRKFAGEALERIAAYDLVEPMQYLFIRIVKARGLSQNENPCVKIRTSGYIVQSEPAMYRPGDSSGNPEWHQVFAIAYNKENTLKSTLEVSIWDGSSEKFLGGVCFDLSDVPV